MSYETLPVIDYGDRGVVTIAANPEGVAYLAAQCFATSLTTSYTERGQTYITLSGGSTPQRMGELIAVSELPNPEMWKRSHLFWGDERWVPLESEESNAGVALRTFLNVVPIPRNQIYPMAELSMNEEAAASRYADVISQVLPDDTDTPRLDLVFLGMGDDGHTASLFPGTAAIHEKDRLVAANYVSKLSTTRLTMTPRLLNAARSVVFLVTGSGKAHRLAEVLEGPLDIDVLPSQVIRPTGGTLKWLVDETAAAKLTGERQHG